MIKSFHFKRCKNEEKGKSAAKDDQKIEDASIDSFSSQTFLLPTIPMNRTNEFRDFLSECITLSIPTDQRIKPGKYSTLLTKKPKGLKSEWVNFDVNLRRLVKSISQMKLFLIKNRKDYVNL